VQDFITATSGQRLDVFLTNEGAVGSRIKARDMIKDGQVLVNGRIARKPALVLKEGDRVQASDTGEPVTETRLEKSDLKLDVLYEDDQCMVINKPAGIPVHPGAGIPKDAPTVLHGVAHLFAERKIPFSSASVLVHRLDKDTTGCLLIGKNPAAHKALQAQFENRTVTKFYLAIVAGVPNPPEAMIDASIGRSTADRTKMTILGSGKARDARTTYRTLDATDVAALLSCELHTGRTHQIRVHLHGISHPIVGDPSYTSPTSFKMSVHNHINHLALHAWKLTFISPADEKKHAITAPPFDTFLETLKKLSLNLPK
jgi:23S rRNA pseudouridine1911/1915/1917 synthase